MPEVVFWVAVVLMLHTYFIYPLVLIATDRMRGHRPSQRLPAGSAELPSVSLVVAAYNEADCIENKIENSLKIQYPTDRFELLIGSDGSDDETDALVAREKDPRVRLMAAPRAGKSSVLNRCIPAATGEIIVLSDANTMIDPPAVRRLVRHFENPEVGAVCGRLELYNPGGPADQESIYWTYESALKSLEGKRGAVMGANGGLYAIRKALFEPLPPSTIVDDFVIPLRLLAEGHRVDYEPRAVAREETAGNQAKEFRRHARIAAGNFQSLALVPKLLLPTAGFKSFAFWSHKVLRWIVPALLVVAFLANACLLSGGFYRLTMVAQLLFYLLAVAGRLGIGKGPIGRVCQIMYYFVSMNWALAVGFARFVRRSQRAAWDRTARS